MGVSSPGNDPHHLGRHSSPGEVSSLKKRPPRENPHQRKEAHKAAEPEEEEAEKAAPTGTKATVDKMKKINPLLVTAEASSKYSSNKKKTHPKPK